MLDFEEWISLPSVKWMNTGFPARVDWVTLGSFFLNIGGNSSFGGLSERWYLTVCCPWELRDSQHTIMTNNEQGVLPQDALLNTLTGTQILRVEARADGDLPIFFFTNNYRLLVYPDNVDESYVLGLRGTFFAFAGPIPPRTNRDGTPIR